MLALWLEPKGPLIGVRFSTSIFAMVLVALRSTSGKAMEEAIGNLTRSLWLGMWRLRRVSLRLARSYSLHATASLCHGSAHDRSDHPGCLVM